MTDSEMRRLCFAVQKVLRAGRDETAMFVDRDDVSGFAFGGRGREPAFLVFSCWSRGRYSKILSELSLFAGSSSICSAPLYTRSATSLMYPTLRHERPYCCKASGDRLLMTRGVMAPKPATIRSQMVWLALVEICCPMILRGFLGSRAAFGCSKSSRIISSGFCPVWAELCGPQAPRPWLPPSR